MIRETKKVKLTEGVHVHFVKSDKFKTILTGLYIKRPLLPVEASYNALLTRIIDNATRELPSIAAVQNELEYQYGSVIVADAHKYGERQTIQLKMSFPNEKYINEENFYEGPVKIMSDMLFDPLIENGGFKQSYFDLAKATLISDIEERKDDYMNWAIGRCIENMSADDYYSIHEYGTIEWVESITPKSLYEHLQLLLAEAEIDIIINGDISEERFMPLVERFFPFKRETYSEIQRENIYKEIKEVAYVNEYLPITQSRLVMGYRMNIPFESEAFLPAFVAVNVFGGGGGSKIFTRIREEESLSYAVFAKADKYKSIMLLYAGLDAANYKRVMEIVAEELVKLQTEEVSDADLDAVKEMIVAGYLSISDYQNSFINYYYGQVMIGREYNIERIINQVKEVTKEQVMKAAQKFVLDTVVMIGKEAGNEDRKDS